MKSLSTSTSFDRESNLCCVCRDQGLPVFFGSRENCQLWRCRRCSLVFVSPLPVLDDDFIDAAHGDVKSGAREKVEFWSFPEFYSKYEGVFRGFFSERLKRIEAHRVGEGDWLDVGCGYGFWMDFLAGKGVTVTGIEPSREAARFCKDRFGLSVSQCRLEEFETERRFAAIVACDVLEHVSRPDLALEKCRSLLLPGGLLYLQVPNVLGFRIPGRHGLGLPYHFWQFNPAALSRLLGKCGFKPLKYWTGVQGVIGAFEAGGPTLLTRAKWRLARALKVGNRLQMIARKVDA